MMDSVYAIWKNLSGNCECYTVLTNYMLYLAGIPTACVTTYGHEWSLALTEGRWINIDSTNGIFDADPDRYDPIEIISFASGDLNFVVDKLSGVYLAGVGYAFADIGDITEIMIPDFVVGSYKTALPEDSCNLTIKGSKGAYAETLVYDMGYQCIQYANNSFIARRTHDFGEYEVIKEATELEEGIRTHICSLCGEKENETIPRLAPDLPNPGGESGSEDNTLPGSGTGSIYPGWGWGFEYGYMGYETTVDNGKTQTPQTKQKKISVGRSKIKKLKNVAGKKAVLSFQKVNKAAGYQIVYATDKKFRKNCRTYTTKKRTVTLKKLVKGKTYYVKVRAYKTDSTGGKVYGKYSPVKSVKVKK